MTKRKSSNPPDGDPSPPGRHSERAWSLLEGALQRHLARRGTLTSEEREAYERLIPGPQRANVETILESYKPGGAGKSYRIAMLVQLAFGLTGEAGAHVDLTERPAGARGKPTGVAHKVHLVLSSAHVASVEDAYQNIAKNTTNLTRGNFADFDDFLRWASNGERNRNEIQGLFDYVCAQIVATSRPIAPMPVLSQGALTFARVVSLFNEMLDSPSRGAHEQFIVASLLHGKVEQLNVPGHRTERVETKKLTASDASSGAAADVQIKSGSRALEAFEVTANDWAGKVDSAREKMRAHDLTRVHIVGAISDGREMLDQLRARDEDVSVLEIRAYVAELTAELTKAGRLSALGRLYELLDRNQGEIELVNAYVDRLRRHGLAEPWPTVS
jgi:hypothetical protein